jgi:hypothetical protein
MPVVITDFTNRVWSVEQPNDGFIHVGFTGSPGPRLVDALDFITTRQKQFDQFVAKRRELEEKESAKNRRTKRTTLRAEEL